MDTTIRNINHHNFKNLIGKQKDTWTIIEYVGHSGPWSMWKAKCSNCNKVRIVQGYGFHKCRKCKCQKVVRVKSIRKPLTYNGITLSQSAWARQLGISRQALSIRLSNYPIEIALSIQENTENTWKLSKAMKDRALRIYIKEKFRYPIKGE